MADRLSRGPATRAAAEDEARRATAALLAKVTTARRRQRRWARLRPRTRLVDLLVAMVTYTGITIAILLGAIYGIRAALARLIG